MVSHKYYNLSASEDFVVFVNKWPSRIQAMSGENRYFV